MLKKILTVSSLLIAGLFMTTAVNAAPAQTSHPTGNSPGMQWVSDQTPGAPAISADDGDQSGAAADDSSDDDSLATDPSDNDDSLNTDDSDNDDGLSSMGDDDSSDSTANP